MTTTTDLRVDLILRVLNDHTIRAVGSKECSRGEHWSCVCGESYQGDGAIKKGRRHEATEVLSALDAAAQVA